MFIYEKLDKDSEGRNRLFNYYSCDCCGIAYKKQKRFAGSKQEHYCSTACFNKDKLRIKVECAHCGVQFYKQPSKINTKSGMHFCCREHKDIGQSYLKDIQPSHYGTGNSSYRKKAFKLLNNICDLCGYSNVDALEVHHKDKNRDNNDISNLQILCANCHTLTHKGKLYGTAS